MKKLYIIILLAFIGLSFKANAQIVNIPDTNFYNALLANGVHDSAGYITVDTAKAFKGNLNVSNDSISDLTGIEAFTAITYLDCSKNRLTSLNVSLNTALAYLFCYYNRLTGLDVSSNKVLIGMSCAYNSLTSIDVSSNTILTGLGCGSNNLKSLNLSLDTALIALDCNYDSLSSLNLKNGHNYNMTDSNFIVVNNPNLTCIEVDDSAYSKANWKFIDPWVYFSTDCSPLSVNELTAAGGISIYPNPVTNQLTIDNNQFVIKQVNIYNVLGQLIYNRNLTDNRVTIDMNTAPAGIYLIQITDADKNIINRKIIKQ